METVVEELVEVMREENLPLNILAMDSLTTLPSLNGLEESLLKYTGFNKLIIVEGMLIVSAKFLKKQSLASLKPVSKGDT